MQAIIATYRGPTNARGPRVFAKSENGSISIDYPHELSGDAVHVAAADALCAKLGKEHPHGIWTKFPRVVGELPNGSRVHVFAPTEVHYTATEVQS